MEDGIVQMHHVYPQDSVAGLHSSDLQINNSPVFAKLPDGNEVESEEDDEEGTEEYDESNFGVAENETEDGKDKLNHALDDAQAGQNAFFTTAGKESMGARNNGEVDKQNLRDDWTEEATFALLEAWADKCMLLNRCNLKLEHWRQVAEEVEGKSKAHKTDLQCKNRLDTLKKKYKHERQKEATGGVSKWPFYKALDRLLKLTPKRAGNNDMMGDAKRKRLREPKTPNNTSSSSKSKRSLEVTSSSQHDQGDDARSSKRHRSRDSSYKMLAKAIIKFGEIFEKMENAKQQQLSDLEKIRMQFTRDLEMQRMQLFMQTQVELAKMKHGSIDIDASNMSS